MMGEITHSLFIACLTCIRYCPERARMKECVNVFRESGVKQDFVGNIG